MPPNMLKKATFKKRILVTGALGQLGRSLLDELIKLSEVYVLASDISLPKEPLNVDFEHADVCDFDRLDDLVTTYAITEIYHLAALLSAKGEENPWRTWSLNMDGFKNILKLAQARPLIKLFWPSSIAIFGPHSPLTMTPQNSYTNPLTMYGVTKLAGERLMEYFRLKHGLDIRSLRFPGIVSLDTPPGGGTTDYIIELLQAARRGSSYTCFLAPKTSLPMLHIKDTVAAILKLMAAPIDSLHTQSSYNISGFNVSPEVVVKALENRGIPMEVNYAPDFRQQIAATWPSSLDDSAARNDWGWQPEYDLAKILEEVF